MTATRVFMCLFLGVASIGFRSPDQLQSESISSLRFISEYEVPFNKSFKETSIGGLSGIDYDPSGNVYYLICDDRSAINPARFYTVKIHLTQKGIDSVQFIDVHFLLQSNGQPYPNAKKDRAHTPDPEAIRFNKKLNKLAWTSEGERMINAKDTVLVHPSITLIEKDGRYVEEFPIPANLMMSLNHSGPRKNGTLEGLTFGEDFKKMFTSVEEPLHEDGERIGLTENKVPIRIYEFDMASKKSIAQYAYIPDPVAYPAVPENEFKINGIPDILWIAKDKLLVMERSFSTGRIACTIKLFLVNLKGAENIQHVKSLKEYPVVNPLSKKLILNMDDLGRYVDNVEGMTLGPTLPNGHRTLILMSDNNFESFEKTQFFLFEIIP